MNQTKLSKQQKAILNVLNKEHQKGKKNIRLRNLNKEIPLEQGKTNRSHSASISRSTKRLEERGLVKKSKYNEISLIDKPFERKIKKINKPTETKNNLGDGFTGEAFRKYWDARIKHRI